MRRVRSSTLIAAGLLVGQGVVYLATPLLSRLYSPAQIGSAAAILAAAGVIGAVATLRFELMLPAAPDNEVRWLIRRGALQLVVLSVLLAPLAGAILELSPIDMAITALTSIGIGGVALSLQAASRVQELRGVAAAKAVQGVGQTVAQIGLAGPLTPIGMQAGAALGLLTASGVQAVTSRRRLRKLRYTKPSRASVGRILRHAVLLTLAAGCNAAVVASLPLLTQVFFGDATTGELAVAQRLALAPAGLVVAAVLPVVITRYGAEVRADPEASRALVLHWLRRLGPLGALGTVLLLAASLLPLDVILGPEWAGVGAYIAAMAPLIGSQLIVGPLSQCLVILGRVRTQLAWDIARLIAVFVAAPIAVAVTGSAVAMVWVVSCVLVVGYGAYLWLVLSSGKAPPPETSDRIDGLSVA